MVFQSSVFILFINIVIRFMSKGITYSSKLFSLYGLLGVVSSVFPVFDVEFVDNVSVGMNSLPV